MKILAKYVTNKYIEIFVEGVTPADTQWEKVKAMLETAQFEMEGFAYRRKFDTPEGFAHWLKNTTALTNRFGGTDPEEKQDPLQNFMDMITEMENRYRELEQEVSVLKKFDISAQEKLSDLNQQLEQQPPQKPPTKRKKK